MNIPHLTVVLGASIEATAAHPSPVLVTTIVTPLDGAYVIPGSAAGPVAVPSAYAPLLSAA
jgi:hypothetical protein